MASIKGTCQELTQAVQSVTKAKEVREDIARMMKPYANWEEYLKPAPLSISILGELVLISAAQDDFSINKAPPKDGFKYIKYPDSFKACLAQVSNQGWEAFCEAHVNMDKIRLLSSSVPELVKVIIKILFQDIKIMEVMLPAQLKNLHNVAENCATFASKVKDKFTALIYLVQELLEACLNAKQEYGKLLKEVQLALEQAKIKEKAAQEAKEMAKKHQKKMEQQVDEVFSQYKQAMESIPTGWDAVGMSIVENLVNTFISIAAAFGNQYAGRYGMSHIPQPPEGTEQPDKSFNMSQINICAMSGQLQIYASQLKDFTDGQRGLRMEQIYDQKNGKVNTNWIKSMLKCVKDQINSNEPCEVQAKAQAICDKGIAICEKLEKIAVSEEKQEEEMNSAADEILKLHKEAMVFDSYSKHYINSPGFHAIPPNIAKSQQELAGQGGRVGSAAAENSLLKAQQSREALKATQEAYQKSFENFKRQNDELAQIYADMKKCEVTKIDFDSAQKMLVKGLKALSHVKEQWEKMVCFFHMISNLIDTCLNQNINHLITSAEGVPEIAKYSPKSFIADMFYNQAFTTSIVAYLVNMIAETYTEVSEKFLMDRVSSLGKLITMELSDPNFRSERDKLISGCDEAQKAIYNLVITHKNDFDKSIEARADSIEKTLKAALPPVGKETKRTIEEAARQGYQDAMKEITPEEEAQFI